MKVRVKEGQKGFYGNKLHAEGDSFTIEAREHSVLKDEKTGKPLVITEEQQFSDKWMEKVKSGPVAKKDK
jgi:hypothetical protein